MSGGIQGTTILSTGVTTVASGPGPSGGATVTFQTEELDADCALSCPSSRDWFIARGMRKVSLVEKLSISVNGKPILVPALTYTGMYDPSWATVRQTGTSFDLTVALADQGAGNVSVHVYFDAKAVRVLEHSSSDCGITDRTKFLYGYANGTATASPEGLPPVGSKAWQSLYIVGKIVLPLHTTRGTALAIVNQVPFGRACAEKCPDTGTAPGGPGQQAFVQDIDLLVSDKLVWSSDSLRGIVTDPVGAFLGLDKQGFVLWIKAGNGATRDFEQIRFNSKTVNEIMRWQSSQDLIEDTRVLPPGCE
jgi:hypothetical protein